MILKPIHDVRRGYPHSFAVRPSHPDRHRGERQRAEQSNRIARRRAEEEGRHASRRRATTVGGPQSAIRAQRAEQSNYDPQAYRLRHALQLVDQLSGQASCDVSDHITQLTASREHLALDVDLSTCQ
jgi:hypothetical protein